MRRCLEGKRKLLGASEFAYVLSLCFPDFHLTPPKEMLFGFKGGATESGFC